MHDRLHHHQEAILAIMASGEPILRRGSAKDAVAIGKRRWELVRAVTIYQLFKHREIFDPIIAHGSDPDIRVARELKASCLKLGEEFRAYVTRWSASGVDHWARYRIEALALIESMRRQMAHERAAIAQLSVPRRSAEWDRPPSAQRRLG